MARKHEVKDIELMGARETAKERFEGTYIALHEIAKLRGQKISINTLRSRAYKWLSVKMNIPSRKCQIRYFNKQQCVDLITICLGLPQEVTESWLERKKAAVMLTSL